MSTARRSRRSRTRAPASSRHEAARGLVLLRQPARRAPGRRRGVPARAPPRHLPLPRHQAGERGREDPHQDALARCGHPGHHVRAGQEERRTCTCSARTTSSASTACRSPTSTSPRSTTSHGRRPRIRKTKIKAREFFQTLAELQFESGYPYIMFEDTVNAANPIKGKHHPLQPVLGDPAGLDPVDVQRRPLLQRRRQGHLLQPRAR